MLPAQQVTQCAAVERRLGRAAALLAVRLNSIHHLTSLIFTTENVDPAVDRREPMIVPAGRQGAVEEGIGAAPGRELGLGASAVVQAGEERDTRHIPGTHLERRARVLFAKGRFDQLER